MQAVVGDGRTCACQQEGGGSTTAGAAAAASNGGELKQRVKQGSKDRSRAWKRGMLNQAVGMLEVGGWHVPARMAEGVGDERERAGKAGREAVWRGLWRGVGTLHGCRGRLKQVGGVPSTVGDSVQGWYEWRWWGGWVAG